MIYCQKNGMAGVGLKDNGPTGQTTGQWRLWNLFGIAITLI